MAGRGNVQVKIETQYDGSGISRAEEGMGRFGASAQRNAKEAASANSTLSNSFKSAAVSALKFSAVSAGIGGVGIALTKITTATVDFDRSMRNVNSIAQLSEGQLKGVEKQVLSLAGKTAQAPKTLADGLYDLVSSGFNAKQSMTILAASAKAATAGLTTTEVSTKAVAAVLNAYHEPAAKAAAISDTLFQTVNRGVITFDVLAQNIGTVLPFASSLGVNLNEVGAAISTMTKEGISGELSITFLKNAMTSFLKPSQGMAQAIKDTGAASGEALVKSKGFEGALKAVIAQTDGSKESVAKLFPNIRSLTAVLALTGKNSKSAAADLKAFGDTSGATNKALSQQQKSLSYQWDQLKAKVTALSITWGSKLIPVASQFLKILSDPNLTSGEKLKAVADKVEKAFETAFPKIVDKAAQLAPKAAGAFVTAWLHAGIWGKLFTVALISKKLGLFSTVGTLAANQWGGSFKKRAAVQAEQAAVAAAGEQGLLSAGVLSKFKTAGLVLGGITAASIIAKLTGIKNADPLAFLDPQNAGDPRPGHGDVQKRSNKISGIGPGGKTYLTNPNNQPPTHHPHGRPHAHGGSVGARGASTGFASTATRAKAAAATYSHGQLKGLAMSVGLDSQSAEIAAAVAQAESGGRPDATNHNTNGSIDVGLWQINSVHGYSTASMMNPQANAKAMAAISSGGTNWQPWVTYQTGAYRQYLTGGAAAPTGPGGVKLGSGTSVKVKAPPPPIAPKFPTGLRNQIRAEGRLTSGAQGAISDIDRLVPQQERKGDYGAATWLLRAKVVDEKKMRNAARAALRGYKKEIKILRHQFMTAPKGRRSKILQMIQAVQGKIADLKGTIHDLGFDITDTELDVKDEIASGQQAAADAAAGTGTDTSAADQAAADAAAAQQALADALTALKQSIDQQNQIIAGTSGTTQTELRKALVDMLNGDLGGYAYPRTLTPGAGGRAKY